ncbi:Estradiol 17-beta-dehydrogenase 12-B [Phytophthora cinnamomi]|uniref:Estradiol 17-beta-dehydrogenase 12-B n=1 Tax=Phytophthora cinnamomi TaxID=4785 RepID=UPI0035595E36|nr:Estradiol 17-beta-dehydrogenase 12-B [Phytophthora cinnamomi]
MTTQDSKKPLRSGPQASSAPEQKRVRLSPPMAPRLLPPLPPLRNLAAQPRAASSPPPPAVSNTRKLAELRRKYLEDIAMVIQELQTVLTFCPGSACPESPVDPSVVLKLVRTVQTLEKLRSLLLMNPARLRRVSLAQLDTVEQQIKMNLLPLATLFRSFDGEQPPNKGRGNARAASPIADDKIKLERQQQQRWSHHCDSKSPRSPSGASVAPIPRHDWRFLSMALSLQL